jgi:hypothetical protein
MRWYKNLSKSPTGTRIVYRLGGEGYFAAEIRVISAGVSVNTTDMNEAHLREFRDMFHLAKCQYQKLSQGLPPLTIVEERDFLSDMLSPVVLKTAKLQV